MGIAADDYLTGVGIGLGDQLVTDPLADLKQPGAIPAAETTEVIVVIGQLSG